MVKSDEVYTFLLRSINGRQATANDNSVITYTINWESVLPKKYKTFKAVGYIRIYEDAKNNTQTIDYLFVKVSSLYLNVFDTQTRGKTQYLCTGKQYFGDTNREYYNLETDINGLLCDYPTNNETTISITKLDGTLQDCGQYFLWIQFYPIE